MNPPNPDTSSTANPTPAASPSGSARATGGAEQREAGEAARTASEKNRTDVDTAIVDRPPGGAGPQHEEGVLQSIGRAVSSPLQDVADDPIVPDDKPRGEKS